MAVDGNLPLFEENVGKVYHARQYRRLLRAIFGAPGVIGFNDWQVTPSSPGAMSVDIGSGTVIVEATTGTDEGLYLVRNSAPILDVLIDPSDPTDDRWDLVVARILDSEHDGGVLDNDPDNPPYAVITGEPDASPADPAVPDNCEVLARVRVGAGDITVTDVDDLRRSIPAEQQQKDALSWSQTATSFDLDSFEVPASPLHYPVWVRPRVALAIDPSDAVTWDVSLEVRTASGGGGSSLGKTGFRNLGIHAHLQAHIDCDEFFIAAGDQQTFFVRATYAGSSPTAGFDPITIGDRAARTIIRPA